MRVIVHGRTGKEAVATSKQVILRGRHQESHCRHWTNYEKKTLFSWNKSSFNHLTWLHVDYSHLGYWLDALTWRHQTTNYKAVITMMAFAFLSQRFYMVLVELPDSHDRCLNSLATFATWEHFAAILSAGAMFLSWGCARNVPPHRWHLWTPDVVPGVDTCRPPAASAHLQAAVDITVDDCQHFLCKLSWRAFTLKLGGANSGGAPKSFNCVWCGKTLLGDGVRQGFGSAVQGNSEL